MTHNIRIGTTLTNKIIEMKYPLIEIGFNKDGEADFSVGSRIEELSFEKMKELRAMIPVAIGIAEDMWRRQQEKKNPPSTNFNRQP